MTASPMTKVRSSYQSDEGEGGISDPLRKDLQERLKLHQDKILSGKCKTMEQYADAVGFIRAVEYAFSFAERQREALARDSGGEEIDREPESGRRVLWTDPDPAHGWTPWTVKGEF